MPKIIVNDKSQTSREGSNQTEGVSVKSTSKPIRGEESLGGPKILDHREVVRVTTSCWKDKRGLHQKKDINFIKKKSRGNAVLDDDADAIGADEVIIAIVNLNECNDGLYEVTIVNESRNYESGMIDCYDYKLIPYAG